MRSLPTSRCCRRDSRGRIRPRESCERQGRPGRHAPFDADSPVSVTPLMADGSEAQPLFADGAEPDWTAD